MRGVWGEVKERGVTSCIMHHLACPLHLLVHEDVVEG